jgi:alpha-L-arabinofuranosidase
VGNIDRRIFGEFLEHIGRAVYEGVFDPGNPLSDENGFRTDVLEALRPLGMPVMRYSGGNYVSACDWKDGIGPVEKRPRRPDFAWQSIETNRFGTDEFMKWCKGNEMDGPWQAGHVSADVYAHRASRASALMKGLDRQIETIACDHRRRWRR